MARPGLSPLRASGAPSMYLWSSGEKEVEVLRRLSTACSRIAAGVRGSLPWSGELPHRLQGFPDIVHASERS